MSWDTVTNEELGALFAEGKTYSELAAMFNTTRSAVGGRMKRAGIVRVGETQHSRVLKTVHAKRKAETPAKPKLDKRGREGDQRDIDILSDLDEGHSAADTARHWGVSYAHVMAIRKGWRDAA